MLDATNSTSSEYKGPIMISLIFRSFVNKILSILVPFLSVSNTFNSIEIPCFFRESIAISAPK